MPKSKKPRKAYHPKKKSFGYLPEDIENMRSIFIHTDYAIVEKLPRGTATEYELKCTIDAFNTTLVSVFHRKDIPQLQKEAIYDLIEPANQCVADILTKGKFTGKYLGTGDQINKINDAAQVVFPYIDESIENCPGQFLREFIATKDLSGEGEVELEILKRCIRRASL